MHYCEHFAAMTLPKFPPTNKYACSVCKSQPPSVWQCLTKGCGLMTCENNKEKHMYDHHEEYRRQHCIFINPTTAQIRCLICRIEIYDMEQLDGEELKRFQKCPDPYAFRQRFLKIREPPNLYTTGKLENTAAHKKSNRGLCALSDRGHLSAINSVVQYLSNIQFYRKIMKNINVDSLKGYNSRLLHCLVMLIRRIWTGQSKSLPMNEFSKLVVEKLPKMRGYSRKDPFQLFIYILNALHEQLKFYEREDRDFSQPLVDDWDILKMAKEDKGYEELSPIKNCVEGDIVYSLTCKNCKINKLLKGQLFRIEVEIPKIRKKSKDLELEMSKHRYESPFKRRRSLFDRILGIEDEFPLTLIELLIEFMSSRTPLDKAKLKCNCQQNLTIKQCRFSRLPNIILIKINRKDCQFVELPDNLDMQGLVVQGYNHSTLFELQSTICLTEQLEYFTVAKNSKNKQKFQFHNGTLKMSTDKHAVYMACYMIKDSNKNNLYHNIKSNVELNISPECLLPDFWLEQLKYFQPGPLFQPRSCKHGALKPYVQPRTKPNYVPKPIYKALLQKFGGRQVSNNQCAYCFKELCSLHMRKKRQKQIVTRYDSYKCRVYCMIACQWINDWTEYLYKKKDAAYYMEKGTSQPGSIKNQLLLESPNKCRSDMKKGQDYKVVNMYVWAFFKQLYGGGPQIQYKTKNDDKKPHNLDVEVFKEIRQEVVELKQYMSEEYFMNRQWSDTMHRNSSKNSDQCSLNMSRQMMKESSKQYEK